MTWKWIGSLRVTGDWLENRTVTWSKIQAIVYSDLLQLVSGDLVTSDT